MKIIEGEEGNGQDEVWGHIKFNKKEADVETKMASTLVENEWWKDRKKVYKLSVK